MKNNLPFSVPRVATLLMLAMLCSRISSAQQWTFAAGFGTNTTIAEAVQAVCTDAAGNLYATGRFNTSINFGNGTPVLTSTVGGTQTEGFVVKFNSAGLAQWAIDFGGAAADQGGLGIVTDGTSVFVTGQSQYPAMVSTTAVATVGGSTDGIVFSLSASSGAVNWARAFGGFSTADRGQAICLDGTGNLYISGTFATRTTNASAWFGVVGAFPRTVNGNISMATSDLFVAQLTASTGTFNWVSTGGAASQETPLIIGNDNLTSSGIAYVPSLNEVVVSGSFTNANATYFSNGSAIPAFSLTNAGQADICVLEVNAANGVFLSGAAAGGTTNEEGLAMTYDASTGATCFTGYFNSTTVSGAFSLTNAAPGFDEIFYARYNPSTNTFPWARNASGSAGGQDAAFGISSNGSGGIFVTGRFQGNISFPTSGAPLTSSTGGADDVFLVKLDVATGNAFLLGKGSGATGDASLAVTTAPGNNVWIGGSFATGTFTFTPSSPTVSITSSGDDDVYIARYNDPAVSITTHPSPSTSCDGLPVSFTVAATGGTGFTYQWQEDDNAGFSTPTTLTNTGIYFNTTTATLIISDNSTVNGQYYRAIVTNSGGNTATSNGALLTAVTPTLPSGSLSETHAVNTNNNYSYGALCALISRVIPSGATPVSGNITSQIWRESSVQTYNGDAYVQRHYQVTPTAGSTATVTLFFSQADFDNFNAHPSSIFNLPTGPSDNAGKANLRITKYNGSSSNGTGLPGTYPGPGILIDPPDANIVWHPIFNRWSVTFDVSGFSGFFIQTSPFALPVNLVSFSAQLVNNDIQLKWQTATETNNDHFELEKSTDGRTYIAIGQRAAMNGNSIRNYDWIDAGAALAGSSKIFYRLKIISVNGDVEYSKVVVVTPTRKNNFIVSVAPVPFKDKININLDMPASGKLTIRLSDISGRILYRQQVQVLKGFSTQVIEGLEKFETGMYFLTIDSGGELVTYRVQK